MKTTMTNKKDVKRKYYMVDASGQILGRLAVKIAGILSGKVKKDHTPYVDGGDFVIVINSEKIKVTGNKMKSKTYTGFSGFSGGFKEKTLEMLLQKKPSEVIMHAVKGMLPKNKLGDRMITRLRAYKGAEHPHKAQNPELVK